MERNWYYRVSLYSLITAAAVFILVPTFFEWSKTKRQLPKWIGKTVGAKITPGLDIVGGMQLLYQVDYTGLFTNAAYSMADALNRGFSAESQKYGTLKAEVEGEGEHARVKISSSDKDKVAALDKSVVTKIAPDLLFDRRDQSNMWFVFSEQYIQHSTQAALSQAIDTTNQRINARGVLEPNVQSKQGDISIELPGSQGISDDIKKYIENPSQLVFYISVPAQDGIDYLSKIAAHLNSHQSEYPGVKNSYEGGGISFESSNKESLHAWLDAVTQLSGDLALPQGQKWFLGEKRVNSEDNDDEDESKKSKASQDVVYRSYLLLSRVELTGRSVKSAAAEVDAYGVNVSFTLDKEGGDIFSRITEANIGKQMAIVLDGQVVSLASIREKLTGTRFRITMGRLSDENEKEAQRVATSLKIGALPISMKRISTHHIGPTLGEDVIERAKLAMLIGALVVVLFMLVYYRMAGLIANLSMICNIVYLLALMALFKATLTLPGIAAVVLSVGMAVDANIIIYERIREELKTGKSPKAAVEAGFSRAFWTVVDAHVVGFVAGVVLYSYGSGPIKGFAVSLMAGIVCNLFTSVWLSKSMFDWVVRDRKRTTLSI